ncbi:MAG: T9SS type A sorting domain-containing protein, partial [Proteobacteria bacterium]|nr:T9SS type A sorting domain-containing protein [Pseudomonadota bacterium]
QTTLSQLTGVEFVNSEVPSHFELAQTYPNPFNPTTEITFALPKAGLVMLEVYDLTGRVVATLVNQDLPAGTHKVMWNARNGNGQSLASGVYLYRIASGEFVATRKMVLLK